MIPKHFIDYYGDQTRWFVGKVVDNNDPKKLGRVKVNVYGVYDDIAPEDLPWAQIVVPENMSAWPRNMRCRISSTACRRATR